MKLATRGIVALALILAALVLPGLAPRALADATAQVTLTPIVVVQPDANGNMVTVSTYTLGAEQQGGGQVPQQSETQPEKKNSGAAGLVAFVLTFLLGAMLGGALMRLFLGPRSRGTRSTGTTAAKPVAKTATTATTKTTGTATKAADTAADKTDGATEAEVADAPAGRVKP